MWSEPLTCPRDVVRRRKCNRSQDQQHPSKTVNRLTIRLGKNALQVSEMARRDCGMTFVAERFTHATIRPYVLNVVTRGYLARKFALAARTQLDSEDKLAQVLVLRKLFQAL
jgi:hypothetical protein